MRVLLPRSGGGLAARRLPTRSLLLSLVERRILLCNIPYVECLSTTGIPVSSSGSCGMPPAVSVDDFLHCLSIVLYVELWG
jgi:hypothetical protein